MYSTDSISLILLEMLSLILFHSIHSTVHLFLQRIHRFFERRGAQWTISADGYENGSTGFLKQRINRIGRSLTNGSAGLDDC
jgi:hypothetical protein